MTWVRVGKSRSCRFSSRSTLNRSRTAAKSSHRAQSVPKHRPARRPRPPGWPPPSHRAVPFRGPLVLPRSAPSQRSRYPSRRAEMDTVTVAKARIAEAQADLETARRDAKAAASQADEACVLADVSARIALDEMTSPPSATGSTSNVTRTCSCATSPPSPTSSAGSATRPASNQIGRASCRERECVIV